MSRPQAKHQSSCSDVLGNFKVNTRNGICGPWVPTRVSCSHVEDLTVLRHTGELSSSGWVSRPCRGGQRGNCHTLESQDRQERASDRKARLFPASLLTEIRYHHGEGVPWPGCDPAGHWTAAPNEICEWKEVKTKLVTFTKYQPFKRNKGKDWLLHITKEKCSISFLFFSFLLIFRIWYVSTMSYGHTHPSPPNPPVSPHSPQYMASSSIAYIIDDIYASLYEYNIHRAYCIWSVFATRTWV